jgi:hypothetical protein
VDGKFLGIRFRKDKQFPAKGKEQTPLAGKSKLAKAPKFHWHDKIQMPQ